MVRLQRVILSTLFVLLFSINVTHATNASLDVEVDRTEIFIGDNLSLKITLSGASALSAPDLSSLEENFSVFSQSQSTQMIVQNNQFTSSIIWILGLKPKKSGNLQIPALSIKSDQGVLNSKSIEIKVSENSVPYSPGIVGNKGISEENGGLSVVTEVTSNNTFVNTPIVYTVKLIAFKPISDVGVDDLNIEGAVVEKQGEPQLYNTVYNGKNVKVVEIRYLITPLQPGTLKIKPFRFEGNIEDSDRSRNFFNEPSFGGSGQDPFGLLQDFGLLYGIMARPFSVSGDVITLNVNPPKEKMDPWLALNSLQLTEQFEGLEKAKVGEPFTRKIVMAAKGNVGTSLPNLESRAAPKNEFRVYADKPETGYSISDDGKIISGWRQESYTLIPEKSGHLSLPEISVPWWDVNTKKISYSRIPARIIEVTEGEKVASNNSNLDTISTQKDRLLTETKSHSDTSPREEDNKHNLSSGSNDQFLNFSHYLYIALGGLVMIVIIQGVLVYVLMRKNDYKKSNLSNNNLSQSKAANQDFVTVGEITNAQNFEELKKIITLIASQKAGIQTNTPLKEIGRVLTTGSDKNSFTLISSAFSDLDSALYAGREVSLDELKKKFIEIFHNYSSPSLHKTKHKPEKLGALNPS